MYIIMYHPRHPRHMATTSGRTHPRDLVIQETERATQYFQDLVHGRNFSTGKGTIQAALLYSLFHHRRYQHQTGSTSLCTDERKENVRLQKTLPSGQERTGDHQCH